VATFPVHMTILDALAILATFRFLFVYLGHPDTSLAVSLPLRLVSGSRVPVWPGYSARFSPGSTLVIAVSFRVGCRDLAARSIHLTSPMVVSGISEINNKYGFCLPPFISGGVSAYGTRMGLRLAYTDLRDG
jgi:hypothetical protein